MQFTVGTTRSSILQGDFKSTPHLLIAGQTGGGKSTFLRQLITTLYRNSDQLDMTLIDLKGGLEFQLFEDLPRVQVIPDLEQAIRALRGIEEKLRSRMSQMRKQGVSNFEQMATPDKTRHLIVVDEAAEIFLGGHDLRGESLDEARRILSQIARQGRAVGIHLVLATQRPDARALDTQVKANLTGVICFAMPNNTSSMTVLDSGRAAHLCDIPGRALWKQGPAMVEVQTPYLTPEEALEWLEPYKKTRHVAQEPKMESLRPQALEIEQ